MLMIVIDIIIIIIMSSSSSISIISIISIVTLMISTSTRTLVLHMLCVTFTDLFCAVLFSQEFN